MFDDVLEFVFGRELARDGGGGKGDVPFKFLRFSEVFVVVIEDIVPVRRAGGGGGGVARLEADLAGEPCCTSFESFLSDTLPRDCNVSKGDGIVLYTSIAIFFAASVCVSFVARRCGSGGGLPSDSLEGDERFNGFRGKGGAGLRRVSFANFSAF